MKYLFIQKELENMHSKYVMLLEINMNLLIILQVISIKI